MNDVLKQFEPKAPRFAVLIFFIFGLLWLILAGLAASGVELAEDVGILGLLQGLCALVALAVIAARLRRALLISGVAAALIVLLPMLLTSLKFNLTAREGDRQFVAALTDQLAQPAHTRGVKSDVMQHFYAAGYAEPPELTKMEEDHRQQIQDWLRSTPKVSAARAEAYASTNFKELNHVVNGGLSDEELRRRVTKCIFESEGGDWPWFRAFSTAAAKNGFPQIPPELSAEDKERVRAYAEDWAWSNLGKIQHIAPWLSGALPEDRMSGNEIPERSTSNAMMAFWIMALAWGGAWLGRDAFIREFDAAKFPGWVRAGLSELIRKDSTAWLRIILGLVIIVLCIGAAVTMALTGVRINRGLAKVVAGVMMMGGMLIFSGLSLSEDSGPVRFPPL